MGVYHVGDTIAALATCPAGGVRAVIRISGPRALQIVNELTGFSPAEGDQFPLAHVTTVSIAGGAEVPGEVWLWRAPRSYTGEDLAELHVPGSPALARGVLEAVLRKGARAAGPGEFTLRAFLNGKVDLTEAEGVVALTRAATPEAMRTALEQIDGGLRRPVEGLRSQLFDVLVELEAALDFADEDIEFISKDAVVTAIDEAIGHMARLEEQMMSRGRTSEQILVAIAGHPNAGKSSLFNALVREQRAIVSPLAGTTRDYLQARLSLNKATIDIVDTPGLSEEPLDLLDARAQRMARSVLERATVILHCVPADRPEGLEEVPEFGKSESPGPRHRIVVLTRCDLVSEVRRNEILEQARRKGWPVVTTSIPLRVGLEELKETMDTVLMDIAAPAGGVVAETAARCRNSIEAAKEALLAARQAIDQGMPDDIVAADLRVALDALGEVTGAVHSEDILTAIFSRFCIGK